MPQTKQLLPIRELALQQAAGYAAQAKAPKTVATYRWAWRAFDAWCQLAGAVSLPATTATVVAYIAARAQTGDKYATITLRVAAIHQAHVLQGFPSPRGGAELKAVLQGIRRTHGVKQDRKNPLTVAQMRKALIPGNRRIIDVRDRAIVLVGFAGAFRRSELAGMRIEHVRREEGGYRITLPGSKTDQGRMGRQVVVSKTGSELCPVAALDAWLHLNTTGGWVFKPVDRWGNVADRALTPRVVATVVKALVESIGEDPAGYAGHSLRVGLVTAAHIGGATAADIMLKTGHKRLEMVNLYIRGLDLFERDVMKKIS